MTWRPVREYEGWYSVSDSGEVRSERTGRLMRRFVARGYWRVNLCKYGVKRGHDAHRLVAEAFIGVIPSGMQVNHIDGNKLNSRVENLEVVTPKENTRHAILLGLFDPRIGAAKLAHPRGEEHHNSVLDEFTVKRIVDLHTSGMSYRQVAEAVGSNCGTVGAVVRGVTWGWLTGKGRAIA